MYNGIPEGMTREEKDSLQFLVIEEIVEGPKCALFSKWV